MSTVKKVGSSKAGMLGSEDARKLGSEDAIERRELAGFLMGSKDKGERQKDKVKLKADR